MSAGRVGPGRPERAILEALAGELRRRAWQVVLDPDGTDYFDLVAWRPGEVGLVEGKVRGASEALGQALRRRAWADWVGVALGSARSADRLVARTAGRRAEPVGVWSCEGGLVREHRAPRPFPRRPGADPHAPLRERLRRALAERESGSASEGPRWTGVPGAVRRASGGRAFREWTLDEPADGPA